MIPSNCCPIDCACEGVQRSEGPNWFICVRRIAELEVATVAVTALFMLLLLLELLLAAVVGSAERLVEESWERAGVREGVETEVGPECVGPLGGEERAVNRV